MKQTTPVDASTAFEHPVAQDCRPARRIRQEPEARAQARRSQIGGVHQDDDVPVGFDAREDVDLTVGDSCLEIKIAIGGPPIPKDCSPTVGDLPVAAGAVTPPAPFIGCCDRMHHLALVAGPGLAAPFARRLPVRSSVSRPEPASRAQCHERCGTAGFCDPSDPLGCGGEHCGSIPGDNETV